MDNTEFRTQRRYLVHGSAALQPEEREPERVRRRQKRVLPRTAVSMIPVAYVAAVAFSCVCILAFSVMYIHAKTELTTMAKQVLVLQNDLDEIRQDNQDLMNEITTCTNLDTIRKVAEEKLDMVPADDSQIVYYDQSDSEYVRQKEDIPNE